MEAEARGLQLLVFGGGGCVHSSIGSFLNDLRVERQASAHTLRSYEDDLEVFCRFLDESLGAGTTPRRWTPRGCDAIRPG